MQPPCRSSKGEIIRYISFSGKTTKSELQQTCTISILKYMMIRTFNLVQIELDFLEWREYYLESNMLVLKKQRKQYAKRSSRSDFRSLKKKDTILEVE
jgi:hypothetical protein